MLTNYSSNVPKSPSDIEGVINSYFNQYKQADINYIEGTPRKNLPPKKWGPPAWKFLDSVVQSYPKKPNTREQASMVNFLMSLGHVLPCEQCQRNYSDFALQYPPVHNVQSRVALERWFKAYKDWHKKGK